MPPFLAMFGNKIITYPSNKVVFKCSLDNLVKDITGEDFVDVGTWKVICKWLANVK